MIAPLRMQDPAGKLYRRPPEIEESLAALSQLTAADAVHRSRIEDTDDPDYVPSECLLHFVRQASFANDQNAFRELFMILNKRVHRAVPVFARRVTGLDKPAVKASDLEIQELVVSAFHKMLCADRVAYNERLDYFEIRFNSAIVRLRATARRTVQRVESRQEPMAYKGETNITSGEIELQLAKLKTPAAVENVDFLYRSKLQAAISSLPADERRVIELLQNDMLIDSIDDTVDTIVKALGCSEKTVRNRRDRAYARLYDALHQEDVT